MAKQSCVGFTGEAYYRYRGVSEADDQEIIQACEARCQDCRGEPGSDADPLPLTSWTVTYKCNRTPESAKDCGFYCALIITMLRRNPA